MGREQQWTFSLAVSKPDPLRGILAGQPWSAYQAGSAWNRVPGEGLSFSVLALLWQAGKRRRKERGRIHRDGREQMGKGETLTFLQAWPDTSFGQARRNVFRPWGNITPDAEGERVQVPRDAASSLDASHQ